MKNFIWGWLTGAFLATAFLLLAMATTRADDLKVAQLNVWVLNISWYCLEASYFKDVLDAYDTGGTAAGQTMARGQLRRGECFTKGDEATQFVPTKVLSAVAETEHYWDGHVLEGYIFHQGEKTTAYAYLPHKYLKDYMYQPV